MTARRQLLGAALLGLLMACSSPARVGQLRFANQPPVWKVNDRHDVAKKPRNRPELFNLKGFDAAFYRRITLLLDVPDRPRAQGVNSLGEVPDSTWFENRIGVRDLTVDEIARGPNQHDGPDLSAPLVIQSSKVGGSAVGFIARDARGDRWIIKFEEPAEPLLETANHLIAQRLLWAVGYHVPEDAIAYLRRTDLVLAPDASIKEPVGPKRRMRVRDVDRMLAEAGRQADGRYRVLASKFLPGKPIGGFADEGVRGDDPNDVIPHEHRRELRGLYVFAAWLQHTDHRQGNTLDVWVEDADRPGAHFVMHYLIDFGKCLGSFAFQGRPADGHAEYFDTYYLASLFTLGLWKRPWEGTPHPDIKGVGRFDAEHFNPGRFKPQAPYIPFLFTDVYDAFWATKILLRLEPRHIRAAVEQGQFDDPRAVDYLTDVLLARQRATARYWLGRINPVDELRLTDDGSLCFRDLWLAHRLGDGTSTEYRSASYDYRGRPLGWSARLRPDAGGAACLRDVAVAPDRSGYTIMTIDTRRGSRHWAPVEVHLARSDDGALRIIGIERR